MSAKNFLGPAASIVAVLALVAAWEGYRAARGAERDRTAIGRDQAALAASLRSLREKAAALPTAMPADQPTSADSGSVPTASPGKPQAGPSLASLLAADPKLMALYLKNFRAGLPDRYGFEYARLGLSQSQIDRFEELTTATEGENMDLRGAAEAQGLPDNDPGIAAMRQQAKKKYQAGVLEIAGVSAIQAATDARMATPQMQNILGSLASTVALSPTPMTYAQAGQLAPILAAASPSFQAGGDVKTETIDWDQAVAQATGMLPAPQLEALQMQATAVKITNLAKEFHAQTHPLGPGP